MLNKSLFLILWERLNSETIIGYLLIGVNLDGKFGGTPNSFPFPVVASQKWEEGSSLVA